jgi:hypothetical protein
MANDHLKVDLAAWARPFLSPNLSEQQMKRWSISVQQKRQSMISVLEKRKSRLPGPGDGRMSAYGRPGTGEGRYSSQMEGHSPSGDRRY